MTKSDGVEKVVADLSERAQAIVNDGHQQMDIMKSAFTDFKALGSMSGLLSIMNTGTLNAQQLELASRIAVKVIAVLGIKESEKGA
ncbi:hypothetical protein SP36_52 [Salmonella phage 36]|uniref:Uncharacterized protein n=3 Tax=Tlsvirus TaxID=1920865 RepID=A0A2R3U9D9_9CAUD|nr:hypothetical protein SP36_52 [Salmonella phage 36]YP_009799780.1 hypothetical protein HOT01_gp26 [Salmonella phage vB_SenS_PHB07]EDJ1279884.1 hypothetical protein [Salmonella enterica]EDW9075396.1 hypothetical protein [Salmonella enterica subsp. enterica serovar 4,[5],12:i:-]UUT40991.1 hypothetical protein [Salmonella phage GSP032]AKJ74024.1 hypothetical protein SP36_52 [Salmonella phage 36]AVQ09776.1 hypothetical protein [Salmonella phage vB_SenS_PHB07]